MSHDHDQKFFVSFGLVMGALFGIFFICIIAARIITGGDDAPDAQALARLEDRIRPVGQVVTDPAALLKMAAAKPAREPYTGEQVVTKICGACHNNGMLNAPKVGDHAEWNKRKAAAGGLDGLVAIAIKGLNSMPPRGGDPDLSDAEIKAAVEVLIK